MNGKKDSQERKFDLYQKRYQSLRREASQRHNKRIIDEMESFGKHTRLNKNRKLRSTRNQKNESLTASDKLNASYFHGLSLKINPHRNNHINIRNPLANPTLNGLNKPKNKVKGASSFGEDANFVPPKTRRVDLKIVKKTDNIRKLITNKSITPRVQKKGNSLNHFKVMRFKKHLGARHPIEEVFQDPNIPSHPYQNHSCHIELQDNEIANEDRKLMKGSNHMMELPSVFQGGSRGPPNLGTYLKTESIVMKGKLNKIINKNRGLRNQRVKVNKKKRSEGPPKEMITKNDHDKYFHHENRRTGFQPHQEKKQTIFLDLEQRFRYSANIKERKGKSFSQSSIFLVFQLCRSRCDFDLDEDGNKTFRDKKTRIKTSAREQIKQLKSEFDDAYLTSYRLRSWGWKAVESRSKSSTRQKTYALKVKTLLPPTASFNRTYDNKTYENEAMSLNRFSRGEKPQKRSKSYSKRLQRLKISIERRTLQNTQTFDSHLKNTTQKRKSTKKHHKIGSKLHHNFELPNTVIDGISHLFQSKRRKSNSSWVNSNPTQKLSRRPENMVKQRKSSKHISKQKFDQISCHQGKDDELVDIVKASLQSENSSKFKGEKNWMKLADRTLKGVEKTKNILIHEFEDEHFIEQIPNENKTLKQDVKSFAEHKILKLKGVRNGIQCEANLNNPTVFLISNSRKGKNRKGIRFSERTSSESKRSTPRF